MRRYPHTFGHSACADIASRFSLELGSECCNWWQTIFPCHALASALGGPILWACVVDHFAAELIFSPRHFHFTITALTVDQGSSSRAEIWWTDLLERWHAMTVPHWKSLISSVRPFLLPMFVYGDCMAVCLILYICQQWVGLKLPNPRIRRDVCILLAMSCITFYIDTKASAQQSD